MITTYAVDLDYEASLFDPSYDPQSPHSLKTKKEFEYIFFLLNQEECALCNVRSYSADYLQRLKDLGFKIPLLSPEAKTSRPFWGHHHDKNLERHLNSKLLSCEVARRHGWGFSQGAVVETVTELHDHLSKHQSTTSWILKSPVSFSGIGHYTFSSSKLDDKILAEKIQGPMLLEPRYDRIFDIGTTFVIKDGKISEQFMVENFNSAHGAFRGGMACSSLDEFKAEIKRKYNFDLTELMATTRLIADEYLKHGALFNVQIDSFIYRENGELKCYPLVEINYRKTMGLVLHSLARKFSKQHPVEWRIFSKKELNEFKMPANAVELSPEGNFFRSFLITSDNAD